VKIAIDQFVGGEIAMLTSWFRGATGAILFTLMCSLVAQAQATKPDPKKLAATNLADVDADFAFQGEYAGSVWRPGQGYRWTGLQVVARGNGNYVGMLYSGGLPGNGWDRANRIPLTGKLIDGTVTLSGGDALQVTADGWKATLHESSGSPRGAMVKMERFSPTLGAPPPSRATVLFDGSSTEHWNDARITPDGLLEIGAVTKMPVQDFRLHLEFRLPYMPYALGQGRANSGVYIQRRYEVQVLDSFGLEGVNNECGGLYQRVPPDLNMCFPPLTWQTYDIWFRAARFDEAGKKTAAARLTVWHNGVAIHNDLEVPGKTGAGQPEADKPLPILLQNHGNPVHFRNLWIVHQEPGESSPSDLVLVEPSQPSRVGRRPAIRDRWRILRCRCR
jgi:hypothetical protein